MTSELRFDGKVAIVTGAGGGLGRAHALLLASRGAKVVVNDLGGTFTGDGASSKAADTVVAEIREAGGEAVANYDSVADGAAIVKTAIDAFGRVDIVINNAGILRDVSFHKMTREDWDKIYQVHVRGSFEVTHAAWPIMREQGYGRVIMTASAAGIYGNFGQANYAMAKLGLYGFASTLAIEGRKRNILVNTIAPIAGSRMTETVMPKDLLAHLKPELVSPLVARLCHEDSEDTGGLYEVGGGFYAKLRWERSSGKTFRIGRPVSIEDVDGAWSSITQFDTTTHPGDIVSSMAPVMQNLEAGPSKGGNQFIDVDRALGYRFPEQTSSYDEHQLALYALAVGAGQDPTDTRGLRYVYEMHGEGMKAMPTFGVIPAIKVIMDLGTKGEQAPGINYGFDRVLHGEQYTELSRPLPRKATLTHAARVSAIYDKGKHALVVTEVLSYDERGNQLVKNEITTFVRGAGGFGGERGPAANVNEPPERAPDAVVEDAIPASQALLYRLTGDWNPLHADPGFAKTFGFERPILHGLCTFGYAARHVISAFAPDGNPDYFKSIRVRFAASVFPGDTLVTEMWKATDQRIIFRCKVKQRGEVVISNAALELFAEIPKPAAKPEATNEAKLGATTDAPATPISADIFRAIGAFTSRSPEVAAKAKTVFKFELSSPASVWTVNLRDSGLERGGVSEGEAAPAQCTLAMSDADFMAMATGQADAMKLFSSGKLKISGDVMASQKLGFLKKLTPEMVRAEMQARLGGAPGASAAGRVAARAAEPSSWDVFVAIRDHVKRNPALVDKVGFVFAFKVKDPESAWTLDLKTAPGAVVEGIAATTDCTLEIAEADFIAMTKGEADPMTLFSNGKLKISGNVMASQKLGFLSKIDREHAKAAVEAARAEGGSSGAGASAAAVATSAPKAPAIFAALAERLASKPELAAEIGATVRFSIVEPAASWVVNATAAPPIVTKGAGEAATTVTLADADLAALVKGTTTAQTLYQRGKLRVDGDMGAAHRLGILNGLI